MSAPNQIYSNPAQLYLDQSEKIITVMGTAGNAFTFTIVFRKLGPQVFWKTISGAPSPSPSGTPASIVSAAGVVPLKFRPPSGFTQSPMISPYPGNGNVMTALNILSDGTIRITPANGQTLLAGVYCGECDGTYNISLV